MLLWQSFSAAPAAILVCLQACIQGQVIVAGPVLAHNGESPFASNPRRASSEDEGVASTPVQETVVRPIGCSPCSTGRYTPSFLTSWSCGGTVITRGEVTLRYGVAPEHPA